VGVSGSPRCPECGQPPQVTYNLPDGRWARCAAGHAWRLDSPEGRLLGVTELIVAFVLAVVLGLVVAIAVGHFP
jgi:disulfide bond formation protein DsbB